MTIGLLSAPSNLGLRPPAPTSVPGCAKAPEALREAGLHRRLAGLGAQERGVVLPGRYADDAPPVRSATRLPSSSAAELTGLLAALAPRAVGAQVTVFDPDLDPDGSHARLLTDILATGLAPLGRDRR